MLLKERKTRKILHKNYRVRKSKNSQTNCYTINQHKREGATIARFTYGPTEC